MVLLVRFETDNYVDSCTGFLTVNKQVQLRPNIKVNLATRVFLNSEP